MRNVELTTESPDATKLLGERLGRALTELPLGQPIVIYLSGELGAGKTTFASGLLRAMGVTGPVRSPTYTLIEPYELCQRSVYHLDLYRLVHVRELEMLALRDLLQPGSILLVEWAERGGRALPPADLALSLRYAESDKTNAGHTADRRMMVAIANTELGDSLLDKLLERSC